MSETEDQKEGIIEKGSSVPRRPWPTTQSTAPNGRRKAAIQELDAGRVSERGHAAETQAPPALSYLRQ